MQELRISPMSISDHAAAMALWQSTPGIGLSAADDAAAMQSYLERNPGLSHCAWANELLIGTVLAGHDGRRGYLHHLCVRDDFRHRGLGRQLIERALEVLDVLGLEKAHAFLFTNNETGRRFWDRVGWTWRTDIGVVSITIPEARK